MASPEGHGRSTSSHGADSHSDQSPQGTATSVSSAPTKRTRVLLSCHPCRSSKLKCDRATPCGQCLKRGKPDTCTYAPRQEKIKPAKTMAARLRRLEGMVRGMVESDGGAGATGNGLGGSIQGRNPSGSVVHSERATNYVGGTHFMAILEDLEDLKTYFEDPEVPELDMDDPYESMGPSEMLILSRGAPQNKEELLALLPDKTVMDRLMNRYFNSNSPSQHIIHIPTFTRQYNEFLENRHAADIHWLATLFMILALGIFFSSFQAPHELEVDSSVPASMHSEEPPPPNFYPDELFSFAYYIPPGSLRGTPRMSRISVAVSNISNLQLFYIVDRFRHYRGACGWALIWGKYSQPGPFTLQAMVLYTEADFLVNRVSQMNCYLLCSTLIRLMLKMGLHRDPSQLPRITPYQGEMRRRMWNLAVQIDLLVAFHLGLPCMIHGIQSDTALPRNLLDSDFDEDSTELPPSRPMTDYTPLTYPINKARIARGFGLVAQLSHSLTLPTYAEIMRVDARIQDVWSTVPSFMKVKPLSECITDAPMLVIQRFGLAALYQKSRCVLHRRYLVDPRPLKEHDYSRRTCLEAAVALLGYQSTMYQATQPGAILAQNGWFIASLAINDFLLADMVVALAIQQQSESGDGLDWMATCMPAITKESLIEMLKDSYTIWMNMAVTVADCRKAATVVRTMLGRIQAQLGIGLEGFDLRDESIPTGPASSRSEHISPAADMASGSAYTNSPSDGHRGSNDENHGGHSALDPAGLGMMVGSNLVPVEGSMDIGIQQHMDATDPWGISQMQSGYDWNQFDALTRGPTDNIPQMPQAAPLADQNWLDQNNYNDFGDFLAANSWNTFPSM